MIDTIDTTVKTIAGGIAILMVLAGIACLVVGCLFGIKYFKAEADDDDSADDNA